MRNKRYGSRLRYISKKCSWCKKEFCREVKSVMPNYCSRSCALRHRHSVSKPEDYIKINREKEKTEEYKTNTLHLKTMFVGGYDGSDVYGNSDPVNYSEGEIL